MMMIVMMHYLHSVNHILHMCDVCKKLTPSNNVETFIPDEMRNLARNEILNGVGTSAIISHVASKQAGGVFVPQGEYQTCLVCEAALLNIWHGASSAAGLDTMIDHIGPFTIATLLDTESKETQMAITPGRGNIAKIYAAVIRGYVVDLGGDGS